MTCYACTAVANDPNSGRVNANCHVCTVRQIARGPVAFAALRTGPDAAKARRRLRDEITRTVPAPMWEWAAHEVQRVARSTQP